MEIIFKERGYFNPKSDNGLSLFCVPNFGHRRRSRAVWKSETSAVFASHGENNHLPPHTTQRYNRQ